MIADQSVGLIFTRQYAPRPRVSRSQQLTMVDKISGRPPRKSVVKSAAI